MFWTRPDYAWQGSPQVDSPGGQVACVISCFACAALLWDTTSACGARAFSAGGGAAETRASGAISMFRRCMVVDSMTVCVHSRGLRA